LIDQKHISQKIAASKVTDMTYKTALIQITITCVFILQSTTASANTIELPTIGRISATTIAEEQRIGSAWLKQYRRQVPTSSDPIITDYLEKLIDTLAVHSTTNYPSLSLVVAKNNSLNAFAVPGGIIGIHTGLLTYAKTEAQLASVLAHELAHLSQRHYARGQEKQSLQSITTVAALLASLVIAANTDGDAGLAALSATQAYAIDQQLRFSRSFEREADRLGMDILVKAGLDPHATEAMFEEMERFTRFSSQPPEFLLTHPLTSSRIIDAINLARQYPRRETPENITYQLVRARAILDNEESPQQAIIRFKNEISGFDSSIDSSRYGLAIALSDNQQFDEARKLVDILVSKYPNNRLIRMIQNTILVGQGKASTAIENTLQLRKKHPDYYPLALQLSEIYRSTGKYDSSIQLLVEAAEKRPEDPAIWHGLAEISGLNNDISLLHKARAEYFILHADFDNAEQQLTALITRENAKAALKKSALHTYATVRVQALGTLRKQAKL
jgi:predicted Zn-dependent protease